MLQAHRRPPGKVRPALRARARQRARRHVGPAVQGRQGNDDVERADHAGVCRDSSSLCGAAKHRPGPSRCPCRWPRTRLWCDRRIFPRAVRAPKASLIWFAQAGSALQLLKGFVLTLNALLRQVTDALRADTASAVSLTRALMAKCTRPCTSRVELQLRSKKYLPRS